MISTGAMVRSGYVYENLMVNLQASNFKLKDRARRIVMQAAYSDARTAEQAIEEADGEVKTAITMLLLGPTADRARVALLHGKGNIRAAAEELP